MSDRGGSRKVVMQGGAQVLRIGTLYYVGVVISVARARVRVVC